jgi:hypothetical protein
LSRTSEKEPPNLTGGFLTGICPPGKGLPAGNIVAVVMGRALSVGKESFRAGQYVVEAAKHSAG